MNIDRKITQSHRKITEMATQVQKMLILKITTDWRNVNKSNKILIFILTFVKIIKM